MLTESALAAMESQKNPTRIPHGIHHPMTASFKSLNLGSDSIKLNEIKLNAMIAAGVAPVNNFIHFIITENTMWKTIITHDSHHHPHHPSPLPPSSSTPSSTSSPPFKWFTRKATKPEFFGPFPTNVGISGRKQPPPSSSPPFHLFRCNPLTPLLPFLSLSFSLFLSLLWKQLIYNNQLLLRSSPATSTASVVESPMGHRHPMQIYRTQTQETRKSALQSQRIPEHPKKTPTRTSENLRESQRIPENPRESQRIPENPRESQRELRWTTTGGKWGWAGDRRGWGVR